MSLSNFQQRRVAHWIAQGTVIAYPTEGVFGLGCDPLNQGAVMDVLALKRRPVSKGLILIAADIEQLLPFVEWPDNEVQATVEQSWPGPVTWVLPARPHTPWWITGEHRSVAVRVTDHPLAAAICKAAGTALVSTSANPAGCLPAKSALQCQRYFGRQRVHVINGPLGGLTTATPIRDARTGHEIRQ